MRARLWFVIACVWAGGGCGLLSGLDQLSVGDASVQPPDAGDGATDAPQASDANADARDVHDGSVDGGVAPTTSIACGQNVCTGGQACCLSLTDVYTCATSCPLSSRVLKCDDQSDCAGAMCCGTVNDAGEILSASCATACAGVVLCNPQATTCQCIRQRSFGTQLEDTCQ